MLSKRFHADSLLRAWRRPVVTGFIALCALIAHTNGTQDAVANGDTRTLDIIHTHTKEAASITFKRDGRYDSAALEKLNWMLRDWRRDEQIRMDPRLFDVVWEVHREVGSDQPVHVVSAYRSPETNSMLRHRSRAVARESQHMVGKAMDFYLPDVPMSKVREIGMRLQRGGVGYYPTAYNPFVHLDVASVRSWPRMTRDQLVRLFPNEKTVHLPASGPPLSGYETARAEILARGGSVAGYAAYADSGEASSSFGGRRKSLWAALFGGGDEDEEEVARPQPRDNRRDLRQTRGGQQAVAALAPGSDDAGQRNFFSADRGRGAPAPAAERAPARGPSRAEPQVAAAPPQDEAPVPGQRPNDAASRLASASSLPANAPLPMPRPVVAALAPNLAAPQSTEVPSEDEAAQAARAETQRLAFLPLPPSRPNQFRTPEDASLAVLASAADAPLPPARPVAFAAAQQTAPSDAAMAHPAPTVASLIAQDNANPSRPLAALRGGQDAAQGPGAAPALGYAAVSLPAPPHRPAALAAAQAAPGPDVTAIPASDPALQTASLASGAAPAGERSGLKALFAAQPSAARIPARPKIATAKAKARTADPDDLAIAPPAPVATSFRRQTATALSSGFSGSAVQGLSGTGFGFSQ